MLAGCRRRTAILAIAAAVAVAAAGCALPRPATAPSAAACVGAASPPDATTAAIFADTNRDRAANGIGPVQWNSQLSCLATSWSQHMAATGIFAHQDLSAVLQSTAYSSYRTLGENILSGPATMTGDQMEQAWMNSPDHRANILSPAYSSMAVSVTDAGGIAWAAEEFGG